MSAASARGGGLAHADTDTGYYKVYNTVVITQNGVKNNSLNGTNSVSVAATLSGPGGIPQAYATIQNGGDPNGGVGVIGQVDAQWGRFMTGSQGFMQMCEVAADAHASGIIQSGAVAASNCNSDGRAEMNGLDAHDYGSTSGIGGYYPISSYSCAVHGLQQTSSASGSVTVKAYAAYPNAYSSSTGQIGAHFQMADVASLQPKPSVSRQTAVIRVPRSSRTGKASRSKAKRVARLAIYSHTS